MGSGGLFNIGKSGLIASQYALDISGNNIANVYTPGYNRRTMTTTQTGHGSIGHGVEVESIQRAYDNFVSDELRNNSSIQSKFSTYHEYASYLDTLLTDEGSSVGASLDTFFSSLQSVIAEPTSTTAREVFLNESEILVSRFQSTDAQFQKQYEKISGQLDASINQVNSLVSNLGEINGLLKNSSGDNLALLDKRDELVKGLTEYLPLSVSQNGDGSVNLYLTSGDSLLVGNQSSELLVHPGSENPLVPELALKTKYSTIPIRGIVEGGTIGGMLTYEKDVLAPTRLEFGRLALTLADGFNDQHTKGMDLNNKLGELFFTDINTTEAKENRVVSNVNNVGNGTFLVNIDDSNLIKATEYELKFSSATDYSLTRKSDSQVVSSGTIGGFPTDLSVDGMTLTISAGSFNTSDRFLVSPTRSAMNNLNLVINNAEDLAVAMPVQGKESNINKGHADISVSEVTDITNSSFSTAAGQLSPPIRIEFLSDTSFQLVNDDTSAVIEGPITYDPTIGADLFPSPGSYDPGYRARITGLSSSGDTFTIDYNAGAGGDNRNAAALGNLRSKKVIGNSTLSITENYSRFIGSVSAKTHYADISEQSMDLVVQKIQDSRDNYSGVNLDEEAANLVRYQQMYQASAQLISVANSLFDSLFQLL